MKLVKALFIFFIVVACAKKQEPINLPECLLSDEEMTAMMVDLALVKSAKSVGRKGLRDSGIKPLEYLFAKHGVDTIVIRENLEYYNKDLKKSKQLYEKVAAILNERKEVLQVVMDSIEKRKEKDQDEEEVLKNESLEEEEDD